MCAKHFCTDHVFLDLCASYEVLSYYTYELYKSIEFAILYLEIVESLMFIYLVPFAYTLWSGIVVLVI